MGADSLNGVIGSVRSFPTRYGNSGEQVEGGSDRRGAMRPIRRDFRGLSEIVGTLFLVLIVVAAAASFSLFVASYQKQLQQEQGLAHDRALEGIRALDVVPRLNNTSGTWATLNFSIVSDDVNPMVVTGVSLNGFGLKQYSAFGFDVTTGIVDWITVGPGGALSLQPREEVALVVNLTAGPSFSFFTGVAVHPTDYLKLQTTTALTNVFTSVFIPPTAIALVTTLETWNGVAYVTVPVLDGTQSFQPGNATLVAWTWSIQPDNLTRSGEKAVANFTAAPPHTIVLTVTNSQGLQGVDTIRYP